MSNKSTISVKINGKDMAPEEAYSLYLELKNLFGDKEVSLRDIVGYLPYTCDSVMKHEC